jgi:hypothetical protein
VAGTSPLDQTVQSGDLRTVVRRQVDYAAEGGRGETTLNTPGGRKRFADRIQAASLISDMNEKDAALVKIAIGAATVGDGDDATLALVKIADIPSRDRAALEAVRLLSVRPTPGKSMEIAAMITDLNTRDRSYAQIATGAAGRRDVSAAQSALSRIADMNSRDEATHDVVRRLTERNLRKQAVDLAMRISDPNLRDRVLAELAR